MISDLLTVENKKVKPTIHCYTIPELKNIIDKYDKRAIDMIAYAFYYACPFKSINPYADFSDDEKEEVLKKYYENRLTRGEEAFALRLISKMGKDFEVISKEISRLTGKTIQVDDLNRILEEEELRKKRSVVHLYHLFLTTFKSN